MEILCAVLVVLLALTFAIYRKQKKDNESWRKQYEYMDAHHWRIRVSLNDTIKYQSEYAFSLEKELDTYRKTYWPIPKKDC